MGEKIEQASEIIRKCLQGTVTSSLSSSINGKGGIEESIGRAAGSHQLGDLHSAFI